MSLLPSSSAPLYQRQPRVTTRSQAASFVYSWTIINEVYRILPFFHSIINQTLCIIDSKSPRMWTHQNHSQPQDNKTTLQPTNSPPRVAPWIPSHPLLGCCLQLLPHHLAPSHFTLSSSSSSPSPSLCNFISNSHLISSIFEKQKVEMLKQEDTGGLGGGGAGGNNSWARVCDTCRSAACTVYCRADSAYLCSGCDARIHAANKVASRHERVWVCEACERAPAAFLCKADAASLCTACDSDIHSANPLARRHHRVPILPISGTLYGPPTTHPGGHMIGHTRDVDDGFLTQDGEETIDEDDEDEAASWLLLNPVKNSNNHHGNNNGVMFGGETVDEYLDLVDYSSCQENQFADHHHHQYNKDQQQHYVVPQKSFGGDSVVPIRAGEGKDHQLQHHQSFQLGLDYETSSTGYGYPGSTSHSVSISSMEVGVVPESIMSDVSISHPRPPKGTIDLFSSAPLQMPQQLTPMDREARVLRYREKKKTRKFEKTIRYASRKAYAETRPRIKGRFAKRTDVEVEVDQMLSATLLTETGYGVVPSY